MRWTAYSRRHIDDGDLRKLLDKHAERLFQLPIRETINKAPNCTEVGTKVIEALRIMEARAKPLSVVLVMDCQQCAGLVRLHDLLQF